MTKIFIVDGSQLAVLIETLANTDAATQIVCTLESGKWKVIATVPGQ